MGQWKDPFPTPLSTPRRRYPRDGEGGPARAGVVRSNCPLSDVCGPHSNDVLCLHRHSRQGRLMRSAREARGVIIGICG